MIVDEIKILLDTHLNKENVLKVWYVKEFLQTLVLKEIYESPYSQDFVFYGGTAIRFLFNLNRLSEDLDFIGKWFTAFEELWIYLQKKMEKYWLLVDYELQKFRITLKFRDFLQNFDLQYGNSRDLYLKIEISDHIDFCKNFKVDIYPLFKYNQSLVLKSFDINTLFATKLNAVLYRQRAKNKNSATIAVKWRDFYDLFWYLQKGIQPNVACIKDIGSMEELKEKLYAILEATNFKEVVSDIENFVEDESMINFIENHGKEYMIEKVQTRK